MLITLTSSFDDTVDDGPRIRAALAAVEADGGGEVRLTHGNYYIGPVGGGSPPAGVIWSLELGNKMHLRLDEDAVLIRRFSGAAQATIASKGLPITPPYTPYSDIRVTGGTIKSAAHEAAYKGTHLSFVNVQCLSIDNVRFEGVYGNWNASFVDCQDVTISHVVMDSGTETEEDGLHFCGGARIVVSDCDIRSGDDALALTQETFQQAPNATTDLADFTAVNCYLHGAKANAFKAYVATDITRTISRVRLSNIVGKAGDAANSALGIDIRDDNGDNRVLEVEIDGFTLDASENNNRGFQIQGVSHVRLANVTVLRPLQGARIEGSTDVELRNVVVDSPRALGYPCLKVAGAADCTNIRILGGRYSTARGHGIELGVTGGSSFKVTGFEVSGALIEGAALNGLLLWNAIDGVVIGNTITGSGDPDAGFGISETPPFSERNLILGNWLANNYSGPVSFSSATTQVVRNFGDPQQEIADSGGFRETVDGWTYDGLFGSNVYLEMPRNNFATGNFGAGRFRAVRDGTLTGILITSSDNTGQQAGTITATVFKNTGAAGDPGSSTGLSVMLDSNNINRNAIRQPPGLDDFDSGDELYIQLQSNAWAPTDARIRCSLEWQDRKTS